jgi:hypothetical protein
MSRRGSCLADEHEVVRIKQVTPQIEIPLRISLTQIGLRS